MARAGTGATAAPGVVRPTKGGALVRLQVSPGAKSTAIKGFYGETAIKLSVAAPPVDGKANAEVTHYLARLLDVPRSDVEVVGGASGRDKTVFVHHLGEIEVRGRLNSHL